MVVALLVPVIMAGTMSTQGIVQAQHIMYVFAVPLTVLIFMTSSQAESGRAPFDLLEAESELVSGFNIEYSGMKFGMFYVAEFLHAFTAGVLTAILFLGGWRGPFAEDAPILGFIYLMIKGMVVYFVLVWVRLTVPRLRIDHMLDFNWKFLVPVSLANLLLVAFVWKIIPHTDRIHNFSDALGPTIVMLLVNIAMILVIGALLRERGQRERARIAARVAGTDLPASETARAGAGD
ncbi:MAG TPA: complex I subunit 1 family protein, partial [Aggregatilineaceae bacterium]|nr:complex I subunit 1 family protein [Aggregatilineaceae bacterium]